MTEIRIGDAKLWHCGQIARRMRHSHAASLRKLNASPHSEIKAVFNDSILRRACWVDGKLAALWGLGGTLASGDGNVWLVLAEDLPQKRIAIVRTALRQLTLLAAVFGRLETVVMVDDPVAIRFANYLGFWPKPSGMENPAVVSMVYEGDRPWAGK